MKPRKWKIRNNDPLKILVVPHRQIVWLTNRGLLTKPKFSKKQEREAGKFAIFHGKLRLTKLFDSFDEAAGRVAEIIGDKEKCLANAEIFCIKELHADVRELPRRGKGASR